MFKDAVKSARVLYLILRPFYRAGRHLKDLVGYYGALIFSRPYFGRYLLSGLVWPQRREAMQSLLRKELSSSGKDFNILEIGTWAGSSAALWSDVCQEAGKGRIFCIDQWSASPNSPEVMKRAVKRDRIFKLFLHNMRTSGYKNIFPLRGPSDELLKILRPESFDFIYIDGDHSYTQVKEDIINALVLLKNGGVLCGDDLELKVHAVDQDFLQQHREEDYVQDQKTGGYFHPGISLAVNEVFGDVSCCNGFWAVRKNFSGCEKVDLEIGNGNLVRN